MTVVPVHLSPGQNQHHRTRQTVLTLTPTHATDALGVGMAQTVGIQGLAQGRDHQAAGMYQVIEQSRSGRVPGSGWFCS